MAKEDDWKRRREREDEADALDKAAKDAQFDNVLSKPKNSNPTEDKLLDLMDRAEPMIEQLNTLYNMYRAGAEKIPPIERRKLLDQIMVTIQAMSKPTLGLQFRYNGLQARYSLHCERWDKLMRAVEMGKKTPYIR